MGWIMRLELTASGATNQRSNQTELYPPCGSSIIPEARQLVTYLYGSYPRVFGS